MAKTAFFVQNNYVEPLTTPVARYATALGLALEDRSSFEGFDPDNCGIDWRRYDLILPYGSVQFIRRLKSSSLGRFILHDETHFATSSWSALFGHDALNGAGHRVQATDVADFLREGPRHLRPDSEDKAFVGAVVDGPGWERVRAERNLADDLVCWMSPLQVIETEWRCWIIGGKVIEVSTYRDRGATTLERETRSEVWTAAQRLAARYVPAPCVVLDMARVEGHYKLIEFNPIHCSGWYKADVCAVLGAWLAWAEAQLHDMVINS